MEEINLLTYYDTEKKWARARRELMVQRVVCTLKNCSVDLIPFEEVRTRFHLTQRFCRGIQTIELARIRGSVGRSMDFSSAFLPRQSHLRQRWKRISSLSTTQDLPAIEVYQVGEAYFVADGNHRVSVALQEGRKTIDAYVCEFMTPLGLGPEADLEEVIIKSEYAKFLEKTRLNKLRPGKEIVFTTPGHYRKLECFLKMFREALVVTKGEFVSDEEALLLWFDQVYSPLVYEIKHSGAMERFPGRTEADLFFWIWQEQRRLLAEYPSSKSQKVVEGVSYFLKTIWLKIQRLW